MVQPTLAIPYFTGVAAFIGNIISLSSKLQNWQQTISNSVLEELQSYLDPIFELPIVGSILEKLSQENSVSASGSEPRLKFLTAKLSLKFSKTNTRKHSTNSLLIPAHQFPAPHFGSWTRRKSLFWRRVCGPVSGACCSFWTKTQNNNNYISIAEKSSGYLPAVLFRRSWCLPFY